MDNKKYDILISFSNEQQNYADALGNFLEQIGLRVFYDKISISYLWEKEFIDFFNDEYYTKTNYCILLLSQDYIQKLWPLEFAKSLTIDDIEPFKNRLIVFAFDDSSLSLLDSYEFLYDARMNNPNKSANIFLGVTRYNERTHDLTLYSFLFLEDIDTFQKIHDITPLEIKSMIPVNMLEKDIKNAFCSIIGEIYIQKDWPGEKSDLFTDIIFKGRRVPAAFMFKGRGTQGKLTIAKCGKNGDQILRLVQEPAIIFFVQHVNEIDPYVITHLELAMEAEARKRKIKLYYCYIDGVDTARLLKSYDIL